jgi:hypothetical protein
MTLLIVAGGVIAVVLALALWYDHRAKRRGARVQVSPNEALQSRVDVESIKNPYVQGGKQDWMTWRHRDRK